MSGGALSKVSMKPPAHYDPDKGMKNLAVADAAINHYRRARDPEKLYKAWAAKLKEQRHFCALA